MDYHDTDDYNNDFNRLSSQPAFAALCCSTVTRHKHSNQERGCLQVLPCIITIGSGVSHGRTRPSRAQISWGN